jgi:hypothetical protein
VSVFINGFVDQGHRRDDSLVGRGGYVAEMEGGGVVVEEGSVPFVGGGVGFGETDETVGFVIGDGGEGLAVFSEDDSFFFGRGGGGGGVG